MTLPRSWLLLGLLQGATAAAAPMAAAMRCRLMLGLLSAATVDAVSPELMRATKEVMGLVKPWSAGAKGLLNVHVPVDGKNRRYVLGVPPSYTPTMDPLPMWILGPGGESTPERFIAMTTLHKFIESGPPIILAGLEGWWKSLNTNGSGGFLPDDLRYTRAVIKDVGEKVKIDTARIRCLGYSRGARFCSMLTSKLQAYISAIGVVGGILFPEPQLATHKVPIVAFHGTSDPVNPYWGAPKGARKNGWSASVPDSIGHWSAFNGCQQRTFEKVGANVVLSKHTKCTDDAEVWLVTVKGGGHTWPGSWTNDNMGFVTKDINANSVILDFMMGHSLSCTEPKPGDSCYSSIQHMMKQPKLDVLGMSPKSPLGMFQEHLRANADGDCMPACPFATTPLTTTLKPTSTVTSTVTETTSTLPTSTSTETNTSTTTESTTTTTEAFGDLIAVSAAHLMSASAEAKPDAAPPRGTVPEPLPGRPSLGPTLGLGALALAAAMAALAAMYVLRGGKGHLPGSRESSEELRLLQLSPGESRQYP